MNEQRSDKRAKFLADHQLERNKRNKKIIGIALIAVLAGTALFAYINRPYQSPGGGNFNVGRPQNYDGQKIEMTEVPLAVENGWASISLDTLKEKKIIYTEYRGEKRKYYGDFDYLPLSAMITPADTHARINGPYTHSRINQVNAQSRMRTADSKQRLARAEVGVPVPYPAACRPQAWSAAAAIAVLSVVSGA